MTAKPKGKPWDRSNPKPKSARKMLTAAQKARARKRAQGCGPPLSPSRGHHGGSQRGISGNGPNDPNGELIAAGRKVFKAKDSANFKPDQKEDFLPEAGYRCRSDPPDQTLRSPDNLNR